MADIDKKIKRTNLFITTSQFQGLVQGLTNCAATQSQTGDVTVKLFLKLYKDFIDSVSGRCVADMPTPTGEECVADLIVYANVMHSTLLSFLSPDEVEQQLQQRSIGFSQAVTNPPTT